jgi:transposase
MTTVEVITSVERRRRWSGEEKRRIVAESAQAERTVSQVARAHGIAPGQLFTWRRQLLAAVLAERGGEDGFVPVRISARELEASGSRPSPSGGRIEIRLATGVVIAVGGDVEVEPLRRVLLAISAR